MVRISKRATQETVNAVASRYIQAALVRQAAWNMDMLARMSVLEGAAGVSPGKWIAQRERGFASALEHFGPNLAAGWTTAGDRGLYDQAVGVANHALRNTASMDGEELVQELIMHSTSSAGPKRQKVFYSIGDSMRAHERDLSDGKITPEHPHVRGRLNKWVENAARDILTSWREKNVRSVNSQPGAHGPTPSTQPISGEERDNLLLLALQSPGGSGSELRRIIDALIDRSFSATERPIVRLFLEKIAHPKYRSPAAMREMVKRFEVEKWFTQAFNLVRREIMEATGISPQRLTNILGSDAAKVFHFMTHVVGADSRVKSVLSELAEDIELLEPSAGHRMASKGRDALRELLSGLDIEASFPEQTAALDFEMNQFRDWNQQALPSAQFSRGPVELRVASRWLQARSA
jgi:hypothetical protein